MRRASRSPGSCSPRESAGSSAATAEARSTEGQESLSAAHAEYAELTNPDGERGSVEEVLEGADVFIGVSGPAAVTAEAIGRMAERAIVFAMANPSPRCSPRRSTTSPQ